MKCFIGLYRRKFMSMKKRIVGSVPRLQYVEVTITNEEKTTQCFYDAIGNLIQIKPGEAKSFVILQVEGKNNVGETQSDSNLKLEGTESKQNGSNKDNVKRKG